MFFTCTVYLAASHDAGYEPVTFFVKKRKKFQLPAELAAPVEMIRRRNHEILPFKLIFFS